MALPIINCLTQFGQPKEDEILKLYFLSTHFLTSSLKSGLGEEINLTSVFGIELYQMLEIIGIYNI